MTIFEAISLGAIQGLTEFLPVSSSGHLVLMEHYFGLEVETLLGFDIILHTATLLAILLYFRVELVQIGRELMDLKAFGHSLFLKLLLATLPAVLFVLLFKDTVEGLMRTVPAVSVAFLVTALWLLLGELLGSRKKKHVTLLHAIAMGCIQAFAITPGISRSGSTISTGLLLGLNRETATRFSFLMAIPTLAGAFVFSLREMSNGAMVVPSLPVSMAGFIMSFVVSLLCIHYFLKFVRRYPISIFSVYLVVVGMLGFFW